MDKCVKVVKKIESSDCLKSQESQDLQENKSHSTDNGLYPTKDTIELSKLHYLNSSDKLKDILSNKHLRTLLESVNDAENAEVAMASAMQEPIFVEFANACLAALEQ